MGIVFQFSDNSFGIFHVCSWMWKNMGIKDETPCWEKAQQTLRKCFISFFSWSTQNHIFEGRQILPSAGCIEYFVNNGKQKVFNAFNHRSVSVFLFDERCRNWIVTEYFSLHFKHLRNEIMLRNSYQCNGMCQNLWSSYYEFEKWKVDPFSCLLYYGGSLTLYYKYWQAFWAQQNNVDALWQTSLSSILIYLVKD